MRSIPALRCILAGLVPLACRTPDGVLGTIETDTGTPAGTSTSATGTPDGSTSTAVDSTADGAKFDVPGDGIDLGGTSEPGCTQVDFLLVVNNTASMLEEQDVLAASVPGFIAALQENLGTTDYQIMVVDTDAWPTPQDQATCTSIPDVPGSVASQCGPSGSSSDTPCCYEECHECDGSDCMPTPESCNGVDCGEILAGRDCNDRLGAGRLRDGDGALCPGFADAPYLTGAEPGFADAFACAIKVGIGSLQLKAMRAAADAVTSAPASDAASCNAGFVREGALLVVIVISDQDDRWDSFCTGAEPPEFVERIVAAKAGNANAIVALGILGDADLAEGLCVPQGLGDYETPTLRNFIEAFPQHATTSVCSMDYGPFFAEQVEKIQDACQALGPAG